MGNRISWLRKENSTKSFKSSEVSSSVTSSPDPSWSMYSQPKFQTHESVYPRNDAEFHRLQHGHYILKHLFQHNFRAPVHDILSKSGSLVLDVGAGPMAPWVIDMANEFPKVTFVGFDLHEPFTDVTNHPLVVPENCQFIQGNILDGIKVPDNHFDYVHQRMMYSVYHADDVNFVMKELYRVLKPNGWLELMEHDLMPKRTGPLFGKLMKTVNAFMKSQQINVFCGPRLRRFLQDSGFVYITTDYVSVPICWGGRVGKMIYENIMSALRHLGPAIYSDIGMEGEYDPASFEAFVDNAFDECVRYQTFMNIHWAYGQKPSQS